MNTPNDLRQILFATVPFNGYINVAPPIARGIVSLWRRAAARRARRQSVARRRLSANSLSAR